jgi:catechol 2,3-dioxygenase-like lactoylglutathione lyase family enzyme
MEINMTPQPNFTLLYVENAAASEAFYSTLLARKPVQSSPNFALFVTDAGLRLGMWTRHLVEPTPSAAAGPGGAEIVLPVEEPGSVDATHAVWKSLGLRIVQEPTEMDFGRTFVALDPDGHRLRVFAPAAPQGPRS